MKIAMLLTVLFSVFWLSDAMAYEPPKPA